MECDARPDLKQLFMRRILTLFMLLTWLAVANVSAFTYEGLYYEVISADDKTCAITGAEDPKTLPSVFVIPDYVEFKGEQYAVNSVKQSAFYNAQLSISEIVLGNNIEEIGESAFGGANSIKTLTVGENLRYIGRGAFYDFNNGICPLERVNVKSLSQWAKVYKFDMMYNVRQDAINFKLYVDNNLPSDLYLDETVTEVTPYAFAYMTQFEGGNFESSNNLRIIGSRAFYGCRFGNMHLNEGLQEIRSLSCISDDIVLPASVEVVGNYTLMGYKKVTICGPDNRANIGISSFMETSDSFILETLNLLDVRKWSENNYLGESLGGYPTFGAKYTLMVNDEVITDLVIPEGTARINASCFNRASNIKTVSIPGSVKQIGEAAFYDCDLTDIYCYGGVPAAIERNSDYPAFTNAVCTEATLHVPAGRKEAYRNAEGWNAFTFIVDDLPATDFNVSATVTGDGVVSVNGTLLESGKTVQFEQGTELEIAVAAADGYRLAFLVVNGVDVTAEVNEGVYRISSGSNDVEIKAVFDEILYTISTSYDTSRGIVSPNFEECRKGRTVEVYVYSKEGFYISSIMINRDGKKEVVEVKDLYDMFFTIPEVESNIEVMVDFEVRKVVLSVAATSGGVLDFAYPYGTQVTVKPVAEDGWHFSSLTFNGTLVTELVDGVYEIPSLTSDATLSTVFEKDIDVNVSRISDSSDLCLKVSEMTLEVLGADKEDTMIVSNTDGTAVYSGSVTSVALPAHGIYIVNVKGRTFKVML